MIEGGRETYREVEKGRILWVAIQRGSQQARKGTSVLSRQDSPGCYGMRVTYTGRAEKLKGALTLPSGSLQSTRQTVSTGM